MWWTSSLCFPLCLPKLHQATSWILCDYVRVKFPRSTELVHRNYIKNCSIIGWSVLTMHISKKVLRWHQQLSCNANPSIFIYHILNSVCWAVSAIVFCFQCLRNLYTKKHEIDQFAPTEDIISQHDISFNYCKTITRPSAFKQARWFFERQLYASFLFQLFVICLE